MGPMGPLDEPWRLLGDRFTNRREPGPALSGWNLALRLWTSDVTEKWEQTRQSIWLGTHQQFNLSTIYMKGSYNPEGKLSGFLYILTSMVEKN